MNNQINLVLSSTQLYIIIGIAAFLVLLLIINLVLCFVLRSTRRKWQLEKERSSLITRLNMVEEELSIPYKERHVLVTYGTLERISKGDISAVLAEEQEVIEEQKTENITEDEDLADEECLSQELTEDLDEEMTENQVEDNCEETLDDENQVALQEQTQETLEDENVTKEDLSQEDLNEYMTESREDGDEENEESTQTVDGENQNAFERGIELAVKDMTDVERLQLDLTDEQYDDKTYLVQYTKGFMAKLRLADDMTKEEYRLLMQEISSFKGMKADLSFNQQRVHKGREAVAILLFKGKKLCVAFALNPADYEETKYHGKDVGNTKRFEKTPMMMKITSERKGKYARHLLGEVANALGLERVEPQNVDIDLKELTKDDMLLSGEMRIKSLGEVQKDNENL